MTHVRQMTIESFNKHQSMQISVKSHAYTYNVLIVASVWQNVFDLGGTHIEYFYSDLGVWYGVSKVVDSGVEPIPFCTIFVEDRYVDGIQWK